jgi:hypothetical protein
VSPATLPPAWHPSPLQTSTRNGRSISGSWKTSSSGSPWAASPIAEPAWRTAGWANIACGLSSPNRSLRGRTPPSRPSTTVSSPVQAPTWDFPADRPQPGRINHLRLLARQQRRIRPPHWLALTETPRADIVGAKWTIGSVACRKDVSGTHATRCSRWSEGARAFDAAARSTVADVKGVATVRHGQSCGISKPENSTSSIPSL